MYQIQLVIKENLQEEQSSITIKGYEDFDDACEVLMTLWNKVQQLDADENILYTSSPKLPHGQHARTGIQNGG